MDDKSTLFREMGVELRAFFEGFLGSETGSIANKPLPEAGVDAFLSHFVFSLELLEGKKSGELMTLSLPAAVQTVGRSRPFRYDRKSREKEVTFSLPEDCSLKKSIKEEDFLTIPNNFFEDGKETIWLQILNLDAKSDTPLGPIRIILGETFKREYPDIFQPSLMAVRNPSAVTVSPPGCSLARMPL